MQTSRDELAEHLDRHLAGDGMIDVAPGLAVYKCLAPMGPIYRVSEPSLCVIAQGAKEVFLGLQKQLRLQEARRLLIADHYDAASAAYRVGYDDPSHFNREYKRLFGEPPIRDVERLRAPARAHDLERSLGISFLPVSRT